MMKKLSTLLTIPLLLSGCLSPSEKTPWNREVVLAPSAFKHVALPKVESFLTCHNDAFAFPVAISSNGTTTICGNIVSLPALGAIITKITADQSPNEVHIQIGADANTEPLPKNWTGC